MVECWSLQQKTSDVLVHNVSDTLRQPEATVKI